MRNEIKKNENETNKNKITFENENENEKKTIETIDSELESNNLINHF